MTHVSRRSVFGAVTAVTAAAIAPAAAQAATAPGIDFFNPTDMFGAQTQRLAAEAALGAADIFEIAAVCRALTPGDVAGWDKAWLGLAERALAEARYFHAASYFRQSEMFFPGGDARKPERFRRAQDAFRKGAEPRGIRTITVKSGNETYDGYWCLPQDTQPGQRVPAVYFIGGADSYAEENYFSGLGILERGIAMLLLDTPGRGSSIYLKGIPTRPDYEVPVAAALDWIAAQPEVDPARMGLVGISMGGYYAPRAAAFDRRCKALVCWSGTMRLLEDLYLFNPAIQRQLQWITGSADDATARTKLAAYNLVDVAPKITCPTLVLHGRNDRIMDVRGAEQFHAALTVADRQLHIMEGDGSGHCNYSNWRTALPLMFDWLRDRLTA